MSSCPVMQPPVESHQPTPLQLQLLPLAPPPLCLTSPQAPLPLPSSGSPSSVASLSAGSTCWSMPRTGGPAVAPASRSRKGGDSGSSSGNSSPTAAAAALQAQRQRANSIEATIAHGLSRRRKRDMINTVWRRILRLKDSDGRVKLCLFLGLAGALWLLVFSTAPPPPQRSAHSSTLPTSSSPPTSGVSLKYSATAAFIASGVDYSRTAPSVVVPEVLQRYPHDIHAFTQGLLVHQGQMWESTGMYGSSELRRISLESGEVEDRWRLSQSHFGEGLCAWRDQLLQLTWREHVAFVYNMSRFTEGPHREFSVATEGWGITTTGEGDDDSIVVSDGSSTLTFMQPETFAVQRKLKVRAFKNGRLNPVTMLNELEFISGHIYANVWQTPLIAVIDPNTGLVVKWIDVRTLHPRPRDAEATPNGIAYDSESGKLYVTGKLWPVLYEIAYIAPF